MAHRVVEPETYMSKRNRKTKERIDSVYGSVIVGDDRTLTVEYDPVTDSIEIVGADSRSTRTERYYQRESGKPKVVTSIPSTRLSPFTTERAIFAYDRVLAIDTNTRVMNGVRYGACVSYYVPELLSSYKNQVPYLPLGAFLIQGIADGINGETIGWHLTLQRYLPNYQASYGRLAIVVDSGLDLHKSINAREVGYYAENRLPSNMTLVYASSDKDKETLQGMMIRACDAAASRALDEFARRPKPPMLSKQTTDPNFEAYGVVHFRRE